MVEQVLHLVTEATAVQVKRLGQGKTSPILGKSRTSSQGIKIELGFPGGAVVKNLPDRAGDAGVTGSIPGLGRSPGEGNDNPFQYSCLENFLDRGVWLATVHGIVKNWTQLSN